MFAHCELRFFLIPRSDALENRAMRRHHALHEAFLMTPGTKSISISLYTDAVETIVIDGAYR